MRYVPIWVGTDSEVSRMNKEECPVLFAQGRDAWNAWATKMAKG